MFFLFFVIEKLFHLLFNYVFDFVTVLINATTEPQRHVLLGN